MNLAFDISDKHYEIERYESFLRPIKKRMIFSFGSSKPFIFHYNDETNEYSVKWFYKQKLKESLEPLVGREKIQQFLDTLKNDNNIVEISIEEKINFILENNDEQTKVVSILKNCFEDIGNICKERIFLLGYLVTEFFSNSYNSNSTYLNYKKIEQYKKSSDIDIFISQKGYANLFNKLREEVLKQIHFKKIRDNIYQDINKSWTNDEIDFVKYYSVQDDLMAGLSSSNFSPIYISDTFNAEVQYDFFANEENVNSKTFYIKNQKDGIIYNIINNGESPFDPTFKKNPFDFMHLEMCTDGEYIYGSERQCFIHQAKLLIPTNAHKKNLYTYLKRIIKYTNRGYNITDLVMSDLSKCFEEQHKLTSDKIELEGENDQHVFDYETNSNESVFSFGKKQEENRFVKIMISEKEKDLPKHRHVLNYIPYLWIKKNQFKQKLDLL